MVEKVQKFSSHYPSACCGTKKEEKPMKVEEKNFHTYKTIFSFFLLFGPFLLSKFITFSFLHHFK